jgi:hypothetical protein
MRMLMGVGEQLCVKVSGIAKQHVARFCRTQIKKILNKNKKALKKDAIKRHKAWLAELSAKRAELLVSDLRCASFLVPRSHGVV